MKSENDIFLSPAPLPDVLGGRRLLLASASPRRRELLEALRLPLDFAPVVEVDESYPADTPAERVPVVISRKKAEAYARLVSPQEVVVTADTVVIVDGEVLGKPHSAAEAEAMLRKLSGRTHRVVTGVTIIASDRESTFSALSEVDFAPLSSEEIRYYVSNYRPFDKAGAYGIQEWIGYIGIREIRGSYYNVMGLPIHRLYAELKSLFGSNA